MLLKIKVKLKKNTVTQTDSQRYYCYTSGKIAEIRITAVKCFWREKKSTVVEIQLKN